MSKPQALLAPSLSLHAGGGGEDHVRGHRGHDDEVQPEGAIPRFSRASFAARSASSLVGVPGCDEWRSLIPVRS